MYHHNYLNIFIGLDLPIQTNTTIPKQFNFIGKFFIAEKQQKTILKFSLDSLNVANNINNDTSKNNGFIKEASDSRRKWNVINDQSNANSDVGNEIIYNKEVLKSNLCDYNDAYILVMGNITVVVAPATNVAFTKSAPFTTCITKTDGTTI